MRVTVLSVGERGKRGGSGAVFCRTEADARDKLSTRLPHLHDLKWHAFWFGVRGWGHGAVRFDVG